jgi:ubiquinone/menaquinone biosynthesis C-methylase UbiE
MSHEATLRLSPNFAFAPGYADQHLLVEQVHPYRSFRVGEEVARLVAQFLAGAGVTAPRAVDNLVRAAAPDQAEARRAQLLQQVAALAAHGVLVAPDAEHSIYRRHNAAPYARHRALPDAIVALIADRARLGAGTRVLDLATGTGSLAIGLAAISQHVSAVELSASLLEVARAVAAERKVRVRFLHDSCNRLPFHEERYDVVTLSLAFHWLDRFAICRGLQRVLVPGGLFFLIDHHCQVAEGHPLHFARERSPDEAARLLDAGIADATRLLEVSGDGDAIAAAGRWKLRQRRPFNRGWAEAYLTDWHVARTYTPQRWQAILAELDALPDEALMGDIFWSVAAFQKPADFVAIE